MKLKKIKDVELALAKYIPAVNELTGKDVTLVRMQPLMKALGNPERKLKIIHVAGTSGKTSTAYYTAALLGASGKKVGLTVSPHIVSINERVQINLTPLPEQEFCEGMSQFLGLIINIEPQPTYFEVLISFAYWYFAKEKVDYAVVETGLGGLHDSTNVARQPDKVCVITDIGIDHTHVLGHKLAEIAKQKAGIIHPGNQVFIYNQDPEVNQVFKRKAQTSKATLNVLSNIEQSMEQVSNLPVFQQRNWLLAHKVSQYIRTRDSLPTLEELAIINTLVTYIPGRMETRRVGNKTIILDGAHNAQKIRAFVKSFQAKHPGAKTSVLLSLKKGKDFENVLPLLLPICNRLIVTGFKSAGLAPIEPMPPSILAGAAKQLGFAEVIAETDYIKATKELINSKNDQLIVTGSFYLIGDVLKLLNNPVIKDPAQNNQ